MAAPQPDVPLLTEMARRIRCHVIRTVLHVGSGHLGGSLSAAEILSVLYFYKLRIRPEEPDWPLRHGAPARPAGRPEWHSHTLTAEQAGRALAELGVKP